MKATIISSPMGIFGFGEDSQLISKVLFKKDPKLIAEKLELINAGEAIDEITSLIGKLEKKGYTAFVFEDAAVARAVEKKLQVETIVSYPSPQGESLRREKEEFAARAGFVKQPQELTELVRQVSIELARLRVRKRSQKRDLMVAQAILSIDDLDKTANLFMGRIREWYGLHFPELSRIIGKHETYAKVVLNLGRRSNFTQSNLEKEDLPEAKTRDISKAAENSMGAELSEADIKQIQSLCERTLELYGLRQYLQEYADSAVEEVAPNIQALVGSLLAARLITLAGGLTSLAKMPASTIQVLGAEKALFRALKTGSRPPKHGIIFQDALIHEAKKWQRGKMSRALAGKLAIAARADAFSSSYIGDTLKADLEKRIDEIREKHQKPPLTKGRGKQQFRLARKRRRKKHGKGN